MPFCLWNFRLAQGCKATLGHTIRTAYSERVASTQRNNPFRVSAFFHQTQGSSFLATQGFLIDPRWGCSKFPAPFRHGAFFPARSKTLCVARHKRNLAIAADDFFRLGDDEREEGIEELGRVAFFQQEGRV